MKRLLDVSADSEKAAFMFAGMKNIVALGNGVVGDTKGEIDPANVLEQVGKAGKMSAQGLRRLSYLGLARNRMIFDVMSTS
jgi:hypothetical protein